METLKVLPMGVATRKMTVDGYQIRVYVSALRGMEISRGAHAALQIPSNEFLTPGPPLDSLYYR